MEADQTTMTSGRRAFLDFFGLLALLGMLGAADPAAPVVNFRAPTFNKEGHRATLLRAGTAKLIGQTQVDATDVTYTIFKGDAAATVDTVLVTPAATAQTDKEILHGPSTVRLVRDDLEITGADWSYAHREKKVSIARDSRIVIQTTIPTLLK